MKTTEVKKYGYANYKRQELLKKLKGVLGKLVFIKRFVSAAILKSGKKADVLITVKESIANGHRIYSIEFDEINKASERFQGLSDAAASSGQGN